jgi:aminopeptidase-like protein
MNGVASDGPSMLGLAKRLFPISRSITGDGVRETLAVLGEQIPELEVVEVPTGTAVLDWTVPQEWNIVDAYILDPSGRKIVDFRESNLHVVGYSVPVDRKLNLEEVQQHLHSLPEQPDAIPFVTSYYTPRWGFCLPHRQREALGPGTYTVRIDSELKDGALTYGEAVLPGATHDEAFLSTYVCHPSMANNELSGPVVLTALLNWLRNLPTRRLTYRAVFVPETIGSLTYISRNLERLKERVVAGFNVTCVGDEREYSYLPSRAEDTLADRVALHVLRHHTPSFKRYRFLDRGSDERQYCSPGVDLPFASLMRSRYTTYPEYHTSLDNFELVTAVGLQGSLDALRRCLQCLEHDEVFQVTTLGEPCLGRRGLYPTLSDRASIGAAVRRTLNILAYCDGQRTLLEVAEKIDEPMWELLDVVRRLRDADLLRSVKSARS